MPGTENPSSSKHPLHFSIFFRFHYAKFGKTGELMPPRSSKDGKLDQRELNSAQLGAKRLSSSCSWPHWVQGLGATKWVLDSGPERLYLIVVLLRNFTIFPSSNSGILLAGTCLIRQEKTYEIFWTLSNFEFHVELLQNNLRLGE